ncbi:MAG: hypothetical protein IJP27_00985 [Clostridia bacterium]|nr:hypothetical protein [Clostridia bacterium]
MVKVITFNLRCGDDPNGHSIAERAPRLQTVLDRCNADLLGFQESTPRWLEFLTENYGEEYEIFNHYRTRQNIESTPMMWRRSRFECLEKGHFWLSNTPDLESQGWDTWGCHRICLWAKLRDKQDGTEFVFFNTHYGFGDECQTKSGQLILEHIKALETGAALVTADFNMDCRAAGYQTLTAELIECNAETLKYNGPTYHGYHPEGRTNLPIDFCFVTPKTITPLKTVLLDDTFDGKFPSDHYGLCYEIEIRNQRSVCAIDLTVANEDPAKANERMSWSATWIRSQNVQLAFVKNPLPTFEAKMPRRGFDGGNGIYWRPEWFELEEKTAEGVILRSLCSGKQLFASAEGKLHPTLPTVAAVFDGDEPAIRYSGEGLAWLCDRSEKAVQRGIVLSDRTAVISDFLLTF